MGFMRGGAWQGIISEYAEFLPLTSKTSIVTLKEGGTPLVRALRLEEELGVSARIYLKLEGLNPTGSFKDRGMTMAVSKALEKRSRTIICASTGNTAASAAAYAAKAGLGCVVLIPEGKIARGKLSQVLVHGAIAVEVRGNFDDALDLVKEVCAVKPIQLVNSINPYRIQGQKTAAFEICDELARTPTYHFIPVGNGGNITAYWMGYKEYYSRETGSNPRLPPLFLPPRMMGFQAEGAAPLVVGYPIKNPETIATAIRIGNPALGKEALKARDESGGIIDMVSDQEILRAYQFLAAKEGVFAEPSSAAAIAGLIKIASRIKLKKYDVVVCTLTGHGLKDPDTAGTVGGGTVVINPHLDELLNVLGIS